MTTHVTGTRDQWLAARLKLLAAEKELTRQSDELARQRQALPWVRIDKDYRFETEGGSASLRDLFQGRSQLIVYHFMFGPDFKAGCPACSAIADGFNGNATHLINHDVMFFAVSRGPLPKLLEFRKRMGWTFPWASSAESDFNFDFNVGLTPKQQREGGAQYNYQPTAPNPNPEQSGGAEVAAQAGAGVAAFMRERPGMSAFVLDGGAVYHTYSAYARGLDGLWGVYQWLDRAPLGRNEKGFWWRHHDRY